MDVFYFCVFQQISSHKCAQCSVLVPILASELHLSINLSWSIFPGNRKLDFLECVFLDGIFTAIIQKKYSTFFKKNDKYV